jgi:hypothetical protein
MTIPLIDIRILFTNYDIIIYFLNLAFCSEHFISIKHRLLKVVLNTINQPTNQADDFVRILVDGDTG